MTNRADPDQKPTDLDLHCLHCLQRQVTSGVRVKRKNVFPVAWLRSAPITKLITNFLDEYN